LITIVDLRMARDRSGIGGTESKALAGRGLAVE
jgi:hypothetical protein